MVIAEQDQQINILRTFWKLWDVGNYWVRWAILVVAVWPLIIAIAAFIGWTALTAIVALIPLLAVLFGLLASFDPLVLATLGTFGLGRKILGILATVVGTELAIGVFFAAVPVGNDPGLIPLALLTMLAIIFFVLGGLKGKLVAVLVVVLIGIVVIMFFGGREQTAKSLALISASRSNAPAAVPGGRYSTFPVGEREEVLIQLPPKSWFNMCTDKPVLVRVDGASFRLDPPCKVFRQDSAGAFVPTETMGDNTSGFYYVKAAPGSRMAEVKVSTVRK